MLINHDQLINQLIGPTFFFLLSQLHCSGCTPVMFSREDGNWTQRSEQIGDFMAGKVRIGQSQLECCARKNWGRFHQF